MTLREIQEFHNLWLVNSNFVFYAVALVAKRYRQPVVMWVAFMIGNFSFTYHTSAHLLPPGSSIRSYLNLLDWGGCAVAIIAAGYYVGWKLMGLLPKLITIFTISFALGWFTYSNCGDFQLYSDMHSVFHVLGAVPMLLLSYYGHRFRRLQEKWEPDPGDLSFWTSVKAVQTRTSRDILHLVVLAVYLRRKIRNKLRGFVATPKQSP